MFGNFTDQSRLDKPPNGFLALADFDKPEKGGNRDGVKEERPGIFVPPPVARCKPERLLRDLRTIHSRTTWFGRDRVDVQGIEENGPTR